MALNVIYDSGDTYSILEYLPNRVDSQIVKVEPETNRLPFQLPIVTESMKPGLVTVTPKDLRYLHQPLFLVGSDPASKMWLAEKREHLIKIGAVGLLIQANDLNDIENMLTIANGLRLVPASAQGFAERLNLTFYPVLLSKQGWEQ